MKVYFNKYDAWLHSKIQTVDAVLLFGSDPTTFDYCQAETINYFTKNRRNSRLIRCTQSQLIENPEFIQMESVADLFNTYFPIIIVDDCTDKILSFINKEPIFSKDTFFILKGLGLRTTSKLVRYFENEMYLACVGCYAADHDYSRSVIQRKFLLNNRVIHQNALELLIQTQSFQESLTITEKLFLYKTADQPVTEQDVEKFLALETNFRLETVVDFLLNRLPVQTNSLSGDLLTENLLPLIRTLVYRLKRLLVVRENIQQGSPLDKALLLLTPSLAVFQKESFCQQLKKWTVTEILQRLDALYAAEVSFKKGLPFIVVEKELRAIF